MTPIQEDLAWIEEQIQVRKECSCSVCAEGVQRFSRIKAALEATTRSERAQRERPTETNLYDLAKPSLSIGQKARVNYQGCWYIGKVSRYRVSPSGGFLIAVDIGIAVIGIAVPEFDSRNVQLMPEGV